MVCSSFSKILIPKQLDFWTIHAQSVKVFNTVNFCLSLGDNGRIDSRPFFKGRKSTKFCVCFAEAKFSAWNLFKFAFYGKFDSRPEIS